MNILMILGGLLFLRHFTFSRLKKLLSPEDAATGNLVTSSNLVTPSNPSDSNPSATPPLEDRPLRKLRTGNLNELVGREGPALHHSQPKYSRLKSKAHRI